jgi:hypothetical protein
MRILIVLLFFVVPAYSKFEPWPLSQCTNGWVDRMTGMCPYRPLIKHIIHKRVRHSSGT